MHSHMLKFEDPCETVNLAWAQGRSSAIGLLTDCSQRTHVASASLFFLCHKSSDGR